MLQRSAPIITLEVAHTLRAPPAVARSMRRALRLTLGACLACYLATGLLSFAALGPVDAPNLLLALRGPRWALAAGSALVVVSSAAAYQVCAQPAFAAVEAGARRRQASLPAPCGGLVRRRWPLALALRTAYVAVTTVLSLLIGSFGVVLGLVAAATFYQTSVLFPILLYGRARRPGPRWRAAARAALVLVGALWACVIAGTAVVVALQLRGAAGRVAAG